jgi:TPR repeat protein
MRYLFFLIAIFANNNNYAQPNKAYNIQGDNYTKQKKYDDAFSSYVIGVNNSDEYSINKMIELEWENYIQAQDLSPYYNKLLKIAEKNSAAAYLVGFMLLKGYGCTQDKLAAYNWFVKSAFANNYKGMIWLGYCYESGYGVAIDGKEAVKWWEKALIYKKNSITYRHLAKAYKSGLKNLEKDVVLAIKNYRYASIYGNVYDSLFYADYIRDNENGEGIEKNNQEAFSYYKAMHDRHKSGEILDPSFRYARMLWGDFKGIQPDEEKSNTVLEYIVNQPSKLFNDNSLKISTYKNLAYSYFSGSGVEKSYKKAGELFEYGYFNIDSTTFTKEQLERYAYCVKNETALAGGCQLAIRLYLKNIEAPQFGDTYNNLANIFLNNYTCKNYKEAYKYYLKSYNAAATPNNEKAISCNQIGYLYYNGYGITKDFVIAMDWFTKASGMGSGTAMDWIASMYENGEGVSKSKKKAIEWAEKAIAAGNKDAQKRINRLKK